MSGERPDAPQGEADLKSYSDANEVYRPEADQPRDARGVSRLNERATLSGSSRPADVPRQTAAGAENPQCRSESDFDRLLNQTAPGFCIDASPPAPSGDGRRFGTRADRQTELAPSPGEVRTVGLADGTRLTIDARRMNASDGFGAQSLFSPDGRLTSVEIRHTQGIAIRIDRPGSARMEVRQVERAGEVSAPGSVPIESAESRSILPSDAAPREGSPKCPPSRSHADQGSVFRPDVPDRLPPDPVAAPNSDRTGMDHPVLEVKVAEARRRPTFPDGIRGRDGVSLTNDDRRWRDLESKLARALYASGFDVSQSSSAADAAALVRLFFGASGPLRWSSALDNADARRLDAYLEAVDRTALQRETLSLRHPSIGVPSGHSIPDAERRQKIADSLRKLDDIHHMFDPLIALGGAAVGIAARRGVRGGGGRAERTRRDPPDSPEPETRSRGAETRRRVDPYVERVGRLNPDSAGELGARRQLEKDLEPYFPPGTRISVKRIERTEAGLGQVRAVTPAGSPVAMEHEYVLKLPDGTTFNADGLPFLRSSKYLVQEHKEVLTIWERSHFSRAASVRELDTMLQRHVEIYGKLKAYGCAGFQYTTNSPELGNLLSERILALRERVDAAKNLVPPR